MVDVDKVVRKLESRESYLRKAPYQRRSKKRALSDTLMKLSPATWLGRIFLKHHVQHEYRHDKEQAEGIYEDYKKRRGSGKPMSTNSLVALETTLAPVEAPPLSSPVDIDPWKLPPAEQIR